RPYNQSDGVRVGMADRRSLERRKVWSGGGHSHLDGPCGPGFRNLESPGAARPRVPSRRRSIAACAVMAGFAALMSLQAGVLRPSDKLTEDEKIEILRNLTAEF